jgi:two-component system, NarL family, sensor histidine kinase UhpB
MYMRLISLFLLLFCSQLFANKDSLLRVIKSSLPLHERLSTYAEFAFEIYLSNPDSAIIIAQQGFQLAKQSNNQFQQASNMNALGLSYFRKGWYAKSVTAFQKAVSLFDAKTEQEQIARVYLNMGHVYQTQKNYHAAQSYNLKALAQFEILNDSFRIACSYQTLNVVSRELKDYKAAGNYIDKSISIFSRMKKQNELANSFTLKGNLLKSQNLIISAIKEFNKALVLYDRTNDLSNKGIALENLGSAYSEIENYQRSVEYYNQALEIFKLLNSEVDQAYERMKMSIPLAKLGQFKLARSNLDTSKIVFEKENIPDYLQELYIHKSEVLSMQGLPKEALEAYRIHIKLKDSLESVRQSDELMRLQTEYESEQKEKQIALLQSEKAIKEGQLFRRNWIIATLAILVLMGILLLIILRNRRKLKDELSKQKLLNRIASDLHDDVGATLSSIRMYGDVLKSKASKSAPELVPLAEKISENAKEMIHSMSDIVWTIKPGQDSLYALHDRIWNIGLELCAPKNIQFTISEPHENEDLAIRTELRHDLFMISKEAINNAVKYSNCTEINVKLTKLEKQIELTIQDNGSGIQESAKRGNGLNNIETRCKENNGSFKLITEENNGTKIQATLSL